MVREWDYMVWEVDYIWFGNGTSSDLRLGSVLVKTSEAGEVLLGDGGGQPLADHGVGVGRVTHHNHLRAKERK